MLPATLPIADSNRARRPPVGGVEQVFERRVSVHVGAQGFRDCFHLQLLLYLVVVSLLAPTIPNDFAGGVQINEVGSTPRLIMMDTPEENALEPNSHC